MELNKNCFSFMLNAGANTFVYEFSPEEKSKIFDFFSKYGLKRDRLYSRMFRTGYGSGFEEWELRGIKCIIHEFLRQCGDKQELSDEEMMFFYERHLSGMKQKFWDFVRPLGIGKNACINRFRNWNFQDWEIIGVRNLVEELCKAS